MKRDFPHLTMSINGGIKSLEEIRAVMAYLKHPLLGDVKYGGKKDVITYQALCAYQVSFHFTKDYPSIKQLDQKTFTLEDVALYRYF